MYRLIVLKNMKKTYLKTNSASTNQSGAMEADTISKNGRISKSQMSRGNCLIINLNKKFLFLLIMTFITLSYAQSQSRLNLGVRAGAGFTDMVISNKEETLAVSSKMKPGFQAGVIAEIVGGQIGSNGSTLIQTGLSIVTAGCDDMKLIGGIKNSINLTYIQLPVNIGLKIDLNKMAFLVYAGPYLGYAISGNSKTEVGKETYKEKIKFGTGEDNFMKAFDAGIGAGLGLQFGHIQTTAGLNMSFLNLSNNKNIKMSNIGLGLSIAYLFGK